MCDTHARDDGSRGGAHEAPCSDVAQEVPPQQRPAGGGGGAPPQHSSRQRLRRGVPANRRKQRDEGRPTLSQHAYMGTVQAEVRKRHATGLMSGCRGVQHKCRESRYTCTAVTSTGSDLEAWPLGKENLSTETTNTKSSALLYTGRLGSRRSQLSNQDPTRAFGWQLLQRLVTGSPALLRLMPTIPAAHRGTCTTCMSLRSLETLS